MRGIIGWCAFVPLFAVQVEAIRGLFHVQLLEILQRLGDCTVGLLWGMVCIPGNQFLAIIACKVVGKYFEETGMNGRNPWTGL